jgi:glutathione S-transferase
LIEKAAGLWGKAGQHIDETFPEPALIPKDPAERTRMRLWSKFVDEGLFDGVAELSFSAMFRERMRNMAPELRTKRFANVGDPRRRDRMVSTYDHGVRSAYVLHGIAAYERAFKYLEETLAERGGPWILGDMLSLADINLMPFAARLEYLGLIDVWIDSRPRVRDWWWRAQDWPSFKRGLRDLVTDAEIAEMRMHGPKIRDDVAALRTSLLGS